MTEITAQFLAGRIDEFIRLLDRMAVANERTAIACEALASAEYEDGAYADVAEPSEIEFDKLQLDAKAR